MNVDCPCKRKACEHYGNCDACRARHAKPDQKYPVACERKKEIQKRDTKTEIQKQGINMDWDKER